MPVRYYTELPYFALIRSLYSELPYFALIRSLHPHTRKHPTFLVRVFASVMSCDARVHPFPHPYRV